MKLKFSKSERELIHKIHLLSGKSYEDVREVFEGFISLGILSYIEKEPITLPFFGDLSIKYLRDRVTQNGREAELDFSFEPNKFLTRNIGQIEDKEESDLEKILKDKIHSSLELMMSEE